MEWSWILFLLLLCPIMMLFMGHGHGKKGEHHNYHKHNSENVSESKIDRYKINHLEAEIEQLREQNEVLEKRIANIER